MKRRLFFFGDAYYHVSIAKYFAFNDLVPPQDPQFAGKPLNYPFLTDLYSGILERLGLSFTLAFVLPSFLMIAAFLGVTYFFAFRLTQSKNAAFFGVALLFFSGTASYDIMLEDLQKHANVLEWAASPDHDYSQLIESPPTHNTIQFFKSSLATQRSSNFGYPVAVVVFILLLEAVGMIGRPTRERRMKKSQKENRPDRLLAAAGVLTGLLPLMRETAFVACVAVGVVLTVFYRNKAWAWFFIPAILLALPQALLWVEPATGSSYIALEPGWRAHSANVIDVILFWIQNLGIPSILAVAGFFLVPPHVRKYYAAFLPLLIAVSLFRFSPDDMNNMKIVNMWQIPTFALAGLAIARISTLGKAKNMQRRAANALGILIFFAAILPGVLSIQKSATGSLTLYSRADIAFAEDANALLPKNAVVLAFDGPHTFDLVGRVRMLGFPAVGWVKGRTDWYERVMDQQNFYSGKRMREVVEKYGLTHISLTPSDRRYPGLKENVLSSTPWLRVIYSKNINGQTYEIFEIEK